MLLVVVYEEARVAHVFLKQKVADYKPWREYFDSQEEWRVNAGITVHAVLQDTADPNTVWIHQEADPAIVEPMMKSPELKAHMDAAGVLEISGVYVC